MTPSRVSLLEVGPDLGSYLSSEERDVLRRLLVPVIGIAAGEFSVSELLREEAAFGAVIVRGIAFNQYRVMDHTGIRLLGEGDVLAAVQGLSTEMLHSRIRAASGLELALLDEHVLAAARYFPVLMPALVGRLAQQNERMAAQMVICQAPRVEDRVLAMLWLLAESWGRVTPSGTRVPLELTHDTLGELIGARRSTVTLAVSQLVERGAVVRQDTGWLLLKRPTDLPKGEPAGRPALIEPLSSAWSSPPLPAVSTRDYERTLQALDALREHHTRTAERFVSRLERVAQARERSRALREQIRKTRAQGRR